MADGEATQAKTLKRGLPPMRITREQKEAIRARRAMIQGVQSMLMTRQKGEKFKKEQKKKNKAQKKTVLGRFFGIYEEEDEYIPVVSCTTDADCTSRNCQNGKCVKYKLFQKTPRRKSTRETYAQQSEKRIQKKSEEINNREITRIVELIRGRRTQEESQEYNRLLGKHPEIKRKRAGRQAVKWKTVPTKLKF